MYATSRKGRGELTDDGHHVPAVGSASSFLSANNVGAGGTSSTKAKKPPGTQAPPGEGKRARRNAARRAREADTANRERQKQAAKDKRSQKGGGKGKGGKTNRADEECYKWSRDVGGCQQPCPFGRKHLPCPRCQGMHPHRQECPA